MIIHQPPPPLPEEIRRKFPELRPLKRIPVLHRVNGIGAGLYGKRDMDAETGSYVKTHCFCFFYLPLIALGAYRVKEADGGWRFLGKDRLSSFAKAWNCGMLCLALVLVGLALEASFKSSSEYRAQQELKRAQAALAAGNPVLAAGIYRDVARGEERSEEARRGLREALEACFTNSAPDKVAGGLQLVATLPPFLNTPTPFLPDAFARGLSLVEKFRAKDPEGAIEILRQVAPLGGPTNTVKPLEIELLKATLADNPDRTNRLEELALAYEEQQRLEECYALLTARRPQLGTTEGARILGQHLLKTGKNDEAYALLRPYVEAKLSRLWTLEQNYTNAIANAYRRALASLKNGDADQSFYDAFEKAAPAQRDALANSYVEKWMRTDAAYQRAVAEFTAANRIINVTLDLGVVQLNRAQALQDPAARKAEFEAAEKTFLAIRGLVGDTDQFRLYLGQVDYWLGKASEGKQLFDQLLAAHKRAYPLLVRLGHTLREVGEEDQARELTEEAYRVAANQKEKFEAASLRAHIQRDIEDNIAWLEKADPADVTTQIDLDCARGEKALREGNRDLAALHLRKTVAGYQKLPQNSTTLNNCGLAHLNLYRATGNLEDQTQGLALLERAVALDPGNSVLLNNITYLLMARAQVDVVGSAIRLEALKTPPTRDMLAFLFRDETARTQMFQRLRQDEYMQKMLAYLDKAMLLAPKSARLYRLGAHLHHSFRDLEGLQKLDQRFRAANPDPADAQREAKEAYDPAKDKTRLDQLQNEIRRFEGLIQSAAVKEHPLTRAYAEVTLNGLRQQAALAGAPADSQATLVDAVAAHERLPTCASLETLISAHFLRAQDEMKAQSPEYAQLAETTHRALHPRELMTLLLERDGPPARLIRQNANVLKAVELLREQQRLFPSAPDLRAWSLLRLLSPAEATPLGAKLKEDKVSRLADDLEFRLNPLSGTAVLQQYWTRKLDGDDTGATRVYQQALRDGVPLPQF